MVHNPTPPSQKWKIMQQFQSTKSLVFALLIAAAFSSCAYFNTFYNTKKYFREALQEHKKRTSDKPTTTEKQKFDKTIEQASKVLQLYPDSKYIDDALMIVGKSFFYTEEYRKAERKFLEVLDNFPNSGYRTDASLWLAKSRLMLSQYEVAEAELNRLMQEKGAKNLRQEGHYWLGESFWQREMYTEARTEFQKSLAHDSDKDMMVKTYLRLGECNLKLEDFDAAARNFNYAAQKGKSIDIRFRAMLAYGQALGKSKKHDAATEVFENIINSYFDHRDVSLAKLERARILMEVGDEKKALEQFNNIIDEHPRTPAAAGALIELGKYDQYVYLNYKAALQNYQEARSQAGQSEFAEEAADRASDLEKLIQLQTEIDDLHSKIAMIESAGNHHDAGGDSTIASANSNAAIKAPIQTTAGDSTNVLPSARRVNTNLIASQTNPTTSNPRRRPVANQPLPNLNDGPRGINPAGAAAQLTRADMDSLVNLLQMKNFEMAELFLYQFEQPDSAITRYLDILTQSDKARYRAFAFFALAHIYEVQRPNPAIRDSILQILAQNYRETPHGRKAAEQLRMPVPTAKADPVKQEFLAAERALLEEKNPRSATRAFQRLLENDVPDSLAQKALYTLGWIHEHKLNDNENALRYYKKLVQSYPTSTYALAITPKVRYVEQMEKAKADSARLAEMAASAERAAAIAKTDTSAMTPDVVSTAVDSSGIPADSLRAIAGKKPAAQKLDVEKLELKAKAASDTVKARRKQ